MRLNLHAYVFYNLCLRNFCVDYRIRERYYNNFEYVMPYIHLYLYCYFLFVAYTQSVYPMLFSFCLNHGNKIKVYYQHIRCIYASPQVTTHIYLSVIDARTRIQQIPNYKKVYILNILLRIGTCYLCSVFQGYILHV